MRFWDKSAGEHEGKAEQDSELDEALKNFRLSIHAWSEAVYVQPRAVVERAHRRIWRLAAGWALGCVLIAGGAFGGFYSHLHRQQIAGWERHQQGMGIPATRAVEPERPAVVQGDQQTHNDEEDLLAKVDSDVSRQVPAAMEPLAQLMAGDETR
jgi:hypothetical protein